MRRETRDGDDELSGLRFLFGLYAPDFYWMSVMDLARRLALSSFLLFMTPAYQILVALTISITFTVACRELRVFYEGHLDLVYYICGWETVLSALALLFMDAQAKGDFQIPQDLISILLIATNVGVVLLIIYSTDRIRFARSEETVAKLFEELMEAEGKDKVKFDTVWETYLYNAPPGVYDGLLAKLAKLSKEYPEDNIITHDDQYNKAEKLLEVAGEYDSMVHAYFNKWCVSLGGSYHAGTIKTLERVNMKADAEYGGESGMSKIPTSRTIPQHKT